MRPGHFASPTQNNAPANRAARDGLRGEHRHELANPRADTFVCNASKFQRCQTLRLVGGKEVTRSDRPAEIDQHRAPAQRIDCPGGDTVQINTSETQTPIRIARTAV